MLDQDLLPFSLQIFTGLAFLNQFSFGPGHRGHTVKYAYGTHFNSYNIVLLTLNISPPDKFRGHPHASLAVLHSHHADTEELVRLELVIDVLVLLSE